MQLTAQCSHCGLVFDVAFTAESLTNEHLAKLDAGEVFCVSCGQVATFCEAARVVISNLGARSIRLRE